MSKTAEQTPSSTNGRELILLQSVGHACIGIDIKLSQDSTTPIGPGSTPKAPRADVKEIYEDLKGGRYSEDQAARLLTIPRDPTYDHTPLAAAFQSLKLDGAEHVKIALVCTDSVEMRMIAEIIEMAMDQAPMAFGSKIEELIRLDIGDFGTPEALEVLTKFVCRSKSAEFYPLVAGGALNTVWDSLEAVVTTARQYAIIGNDGVIWRPTAGTMTAAHWLLRLGFPHAAYSEFQKDPNVEPGLGPILSDRCTRLDKVSANTGGADDLAEWARIDLRRRDYYEGLAFRSWLEAEYRERFQAAAPNTSEPDLLTLARGSSPLTTSKTFNRIRTLLRSPALPRVYRKKSVRSTTKFLLSSQEAVTTAARSSHGSGALSAQARSRLLALLPPGGPRHPSESPLAGRLALIWAVGPRDKYSVAESLRSRDYTDLAKRFSSSGAGKIGLSFLLIGSAGGPLDPTVGTATAQVNSLWRDSGSLPTGVSHSDSTFTAGQAPLRTPEVRELARQWLAERATTLDGIVVLGVGERSQFLGLFEAAIEHSAMAAIPLYVQTLGDVRANTPSTRFRAVARLTHSDAALTACISRALRTLSLDTAKRLAEIAYGPSDAIVQSIRDVQELLLPPKGSDAGSILALVTICRSLLRNYGTSLSDADKVRIFHIAADCLDQGRKAGQPWSKPTKRNEGTWWFGAIWTVRSAFQVNHGTTGTGTSGVDPLDEIATDALQAAEMLGAEKKVTLIGLLNLAIRAMEKSGSGDKQASQIILGEWQAVLKTLNTAQNSATAALDQEARIAAIYDVP